MVDHVLLYNSAVCRLCGEENENGSFLYTQDEPELSLNVLINTYLPLKVSDDGELPRTICPGCAIQLEAVVEFINLIIKGQKIIRDLHQREKQYKRAILKSEPPEVITENIIYEINTSDGIYHVEHPISLQVCGLDKPKRKRGRPPKIPKTDEELAQEAAAEERRRIEEAAQVKTKEEPTGKRRRKTPTRFKEVVQGKELEKILLAEGVIDEIESDPEVKPEVPPPPPPCQEPEVIGVFENKGQLLEIVVTKGKGRGRPRGTTRTTRETCAICGMEFVSIGRYMSHVAQHGPVIYQCTECKEMFKERILFNEHQTQTEHTGQHVIFCNDMKQEIDSDEKGNEGNGNSAVGEEATADLLAVNVKNDETLQETKPSNLEASEEQTAKDVELSGQGKPKLKCSLCTKTFSNRQSKSLHFKAVHEGRRRFMCGVCGAVFAYPRSLQLHKAKHAKDKGYACDLCGKVLNHPSSVVYHKETVHSQRQYVCLKCGKWFKHRQLLQRHQLVHSQQRPHTCQTCNASFKSRANLLNHELLHTGVKRFSCEICKQKFAHKTSLTMHTRLHTGIKPYSCLICGKSFSQKGNLCEHARIHTGERPYRCEVCGRSFTTSSQHRLHVKRHAQHKPTMCGGCRQQFPSRAAWRDHECRTAETATDQISSVQQESQQAEESEQQVSVVEELSASSPRVIYVTYEDIDNYHMLSDQVSTIEDPTMFTNQRLSLDADDDAETIYVQADNVQHIAVTDSDGNPWQLSCVRAADDSEQVVVEASEGVHQLSLQKADAAPVAHYFTIV